MDCCASAQLSKQLARPAPITDEGGLPKRDRVHGDLVWITRPIPGYTEREFKKP